MPSPPRAERTGVLLLNLGTPDAPRPREVRRYLREFLGDPRVLDVPAWVRWAMLNFVILPFRPRQSAHAYQKIWTEAGSPLGVHTEALRAAMADRLGNAYVVAAGMRYGNPTLADAVEALARARVARIVVFPLFPQYASSSTGSALEAAYGEIARRWTVLPVTTIPAFYDAPGFIRALAARTRPHLAKLEPDHVLLSYHGLPERQIRRCDPEGRHCFVRADCCEAIGDANRDCYRAQCYATSRALARELQLPPERVSVAFQSRLGRTPWIRPYTDERLPELAAAGVRRLAVVCPSFVADCLETLEEIGLRASEQWHSVGGESLRLVPCLNDDPVWVEAACALVRSACRGST